MRIALFQPEIPGNVGAILRLAACFDAPVDIIEPCGFVFSDARLRRAGMDYAQHVSFTRHADWEAFQALPRERLILLSTKSETTLDHFAFEAGDTLLFGQESAGAPEHVRAACDAIVRIPLNPQMRSLNISVSAGIALWEALRQTQSLPATDVGPTC